MSLPNLKSVRRKKPLTLSLKSNMPPDMPNDTIPWGTLEFASEKELRPEFGPLRIRLIRRGHDLLLVEIRDNREIVQLGTDPESDFRRYAFAREIERIHLQPRMPDRPVVVQPAHPLRLAPKAEVDFYVSIPVNIQLFTDQRQKTEPLERIPSEVLSDTWFGNQTGGILCYAIKSRARREPPAPGTTPRNHATCKIRIHNKSSEQLHCTKFCLRLNHCHLWQSGGDLWTAPIHITHNGDDHLSTIDYSEKAPSDLPNAERIADAEDPPTNGLIRRTFTSITTALS